MDDRSIDRIDLESSTPEPNSPDPDLESYFRQKLEQLYANPSQALVARDGCQATAENAQDRNDKEYEFRLFRRPLVSGPALIDTSSGPQRITLRSPSPAGDGLHFVNGGRPDEYYFSGDTSSELAQQYAQAAISEQDIISGLKLRWVCWLAAGMKDLDLTTGTERHGFTMASHHNQSYQPWQSGETGAWIARTDQQEEAQWKEKAHCEPEKDRGKIYRGSIS